MRFRACAVAVVVMTTIAAAGNAQQQSECFVWSVGDAAAASASAAWIVLHDRAAMGGGEWKVAVLSGPIVGTARGQAARWMNLDADSVYISWDNGLTRGVYTLGRTGTGLAGRVTLTATDVVVVDSTGTRIPYTPRTWSVVATRRPCPTDQDS